MASELIFDEDKQEIGFVRNHLPQELKELLSDDDLLYFGDVIFDFMESRGLIGEEGDDEIESEYDYEELLAYVVKSARKDEVCTTLSPEQIELIVQGELAYYDSLADGEE